ncbi:MAG TPA: ribulose-phosphate 3-epimerase [Phycisphaerales bacterium]|nr:ribulose-phosphate 3-epimerase [Phycisphaerales bacterium]
MVAPSVLSADFANMETDCRAAMAAGADLLHLDVMDGHFVPNLTMGPDLCRCLRKALPQAYLDVHLMVTNPGMFIEPFAKAGANHFAFHVEVTPPDQVEPMIARIRSLGMQAGLVINPPTPVEKILPFVHLPDLVLVMSVNPGFSGQSFIASALDKTRAIAAKLRKDQRLQMDGGVTPANAHIVREAGCDVMVTGSALFSSPREKWGEVIGAMKGQSPRQAGR